MTTVEERVQELRDWLDEEIAVGGNTSYTCQMVREKLDTLFPMDDESWMDRGLYRLSIGSSGIHFYKPDQPRNGVNGVEFVWIRILDPDNNVVGPQVAIRQSEGDRIADEWPQNIRTRDVALYTLERMLAEPRKKGDVYGRL